MKTKICTKCNKEKSITEFYKRNEGYGDGYRVECKKCHNNKSKKYREEHKKEKKEYFKQYYIKNREELLENQKQYNVDNKEDVEVYLKQYYIDNKEDIKESSRKWRKNNPGYYKNKRNNDLNYRILQNLRCRFRGVLKGNPKIDTTIKLVGCSIDFLKNHLEKYFYDNMTWDNYGSYWEIDHIIPCSSFDFTKKEDQIKCFHWTNLQPLTKKHNREKAGKVDWVKK